MLVRCRCGKLNNKNDDQRSVVCTNCWETTVYWIAKNPIPPQTPEIIAILREREAEDLERWRDSH